MLVHLLFKDSKSLKQSLEGVLSLTCIIFSASFLITQFSRAELRMSMLLAAVVVRFSSHHFVVFSMESLGFFFYCFSRVTCRDGLFFF